jgi:segregation and condensation protein B
MADAAAAWDETNVRSLAPEDQRLHLRMLEAILFAAAEPLSSAEIALRMPEGVDLGSLLHELQAAYAGRGVNLRRTDDRWAFRTAEDLAFVLRRDVVQEKKLSRAAVETLAIIAYHQPVTRAEIEDVRGVAVSRGTLDVLLEAGWVRLRGRRRTPGRPVTFGTTPGFLDHFGLESIGDLPGLSDLKAAGLIESLAMPGEEMPAPNDSPDLAADEDPLEPGFDGFDDAEGPVEDDADESAAAEASESGEESDGEDQDRRED